MSHHFNKDWVRVYKVTFNSANIFLHTASRKIGDGPTDYEYIDLEDNNTLTITEEQIPIIQIQKFGDGISSMTYVGKLFEYFVKKENKEEEK